jgi:nucleoside-triphosphatase
MQYNGHMGKAILLTGRPGSGKTTLIRRVVAELSKPAGGFYTQEIRVANVRKGFEIVTLDGKRDILAHVDIGGRARIGKYGVDIAALDRLGVVAIEETVAAGGIVVVDEIGPMEMLSHYFRTAVLEALKSDSMLLGTIAKRRNPSCDQVRALPQVTVMEIDPRNREALLPVLLNLFLGPPSSRSQGK